MSDQDSIILEGEISFLLDGVKVKPFRFWTIFIEFSLMNGSEFH